MNFIKKLRRQKRNQLARAEAIQARARALSIQYQDFALNRTTPGTASNGPIPLVISLTTFSRRIDEVYLTIESLFQQSHKADRVVLWLSKEEFSPDDVPAILRKQCQRGLQIEFCEKNLGPYKKFFYTLQKYPDSLILTVDDDVIYPIDMVDKLYRAYCRQPNVIHCHRAHQITFDASGRLLPYQEWELAPMDGKPSANVFPTGIGGVLYFPGCFDTEIVDESTFMTLAPGADDVWLKAMTLRKGVMSCKIVDQRDWWLRYVMIPGSQAVSLKHQNKRSQSGNDDKFKAVFDRYSLWPLLEKNT
ncbi:Hypothetical protein HDN1F_27740 [gamma proteobacterium HdN1]|nr:Hypothetical protein HDN1F_27740 [gamma proteobacterium HdN1]